jgi:hypothetical protein
MAALNMTAWINRQLTRMYEEGGEGGAPNEGYRVVQFTLLHMRQTTVEDEVHTLKLGSKQWTGKELADRFDQLACTHASGLSGSQQFVLRVFYFDESLSVENLPFRKAGESQDIGIGTEGPTATGLTAQLMRLNESLVRINTIHSDSLLKQQGAMVESLMEALQQQRAENVHAFEVVKELVMERARAEHDGSKELLLIQRKTAERNKLLSLMPGLVNKIVGRNILPEGGIAELALSHLKSTLTPEQIEQIGMVLSPDQLSVLLPLLQSAEPATPAPSGETNANPT